MPHHEPTEFPENPCPTEECVWGGEWFARRIKWCSVCVDELRAGMTVEVEISQNRRVGENQWVPALIGLYIGTPTGDLGPPQSEHTVEVMRPEVGIFIDLTATRARQLANELMRHVALIERGEAHTG